MENPFEEIAERLARIEHILAQLVVSLPAVQEDEKPLTVTEAAAYISLQPSTLYGLVHRRKIPFIKRGKRLYFLKADLVQWLKEGRKAATASSETTYRISSVRRRVVKIG